MQCILIDFVTQEVDSDDEWQGLVEATDTTKADVTAAHSLMGDKTFLNRLKSRLHRSSVQLLEARLEGASRLRPVLRIVINIITAPDRLVLQNMVQYFRPQHVILTIRYSACQITTVSATR